MKQTIKTSWLSDMAFEAEVDGHKIYLDTAQEHGGKNMGPPPKQLMMVALAGCTAMDVISMLKKMRQEVEAFDVEVEGDRSDEHPKKYNAMKVIYHIKGKNISRKNVEKAVDLSTNRYCGVSANYSKAFPITHEIRIEES
jgi:putative redox protein